MISLERIRACTNPECREVLPADPDDPKGAGFSVTKRVDGRVVSFEGRCRACVTARRHRGQVRKNRLVYDGVRDGRPVKLKVCRQCDREKVCEDGPGSEFAIQLRREGYSITWNPLCKACKNKNIKERRANDPEYAQRLRSRNLEYNRRWKQDPENLEKARAASRKYWRKLKREHPDRILEYARMSYVFRQERKGKTVHHYRTVIDGTAPRVTVAPFRRWLRRYAQLADLADNAEALAISLGLTPRRVRGIFAEEGLQVTIDVVDRALTNARFIVFLDGKMIVGVDDLYREELEDVC